MVSDELASETKEDEMGLRAKWDGMTEAQKVRAVADEPLNTKFCTECHGFAGKPYTDSRGKQQWRNCSTCGGTGCAPIR